MVHSVLASTASRAGFGVGEAGDAEGGHVRSRAAVQAPDVPLDQEDLRGVRGLFPGQGVDGVEQAGLVLLDQTVTSRSPGRARSGGVRTPPAHYPR